jgi:RimJ/RimL family protein N-acetyltransferase
LTGAESRCYSGPQPGDARRIEGVDAFEEKIDVSEKRVELLRGAQILLRLTQESDAERIVEWRNRPDTVRWLYQWEPLTVEAHLRWFRAAPDRGDLLLVFETLEGEPIGCTSLQDFDHLASQAEWGRLCAAQIGARSHGILEGCYLLNRMCFEALDFIRIHGHVSTANERAWRLYQFLGWVEEGVRRKHWVHPGGYDDVRVISVLPEEFEAARRGVESKLYGDGPIPAFSEDQVAVARECVQNRFTRR